MFEKIKRVAGLISLSLFVSVSCASYAFGAEMVNVCNKGDMEIFYASLGWEDGFLSSRAKIQGLFSIDPGKCRNIVPSEMSDVTVAFFYKDRSGTLRNTIFPVKDDEGLFETEYSQICVGLKDFGAHSIQEHLSLKQFIEIWIPPCSHEYFPAKTSFGVGGGTNNIYTIDIAPSMEALIPPLPHMSYR